jgi:hypothetical protein
MDMKRFTMHSQDRQDAIQQRRQAEWDRMFQKTPAGMRGPVIDQGEQVKAIPPDIAKEMRADDMFSVASRAAGGMNPSTGRPTKLEEFMRTIGQMYDPAKHDKFSIIKRLEGMGITASSINDLRGKPGVDAAIQALIGDIQSVPMTKGSWDDFAPVIGDSAGFPPGLFNRR